MRIAICDDELFGRQQLKEYLERSEYYNNMEIVEFTSGEEFVKSLSHESKIDIVFLDIEMNKIDGIDTAKLIRINDKNIIIIFVSSHRERVFDTFDCETFNFITKPFTEARFNEVLTKAIDKYKLLHADFVLTWKNENIRLPIKEIKFFESYRKHIIFHTYNGEYEMVAKLSDTLDKLSQYDFIQTHQGYVVNMNLIRRFDGLDIILLDGTKVPMSMRKKTEVLSEYAKFVMRCKA